MSTGAGNAYLVTDLSSPTSCAELRSLLSPSGSCDSGNSSGNNDNDEGSDKGGDKYKVERSLYISIDEATSTTEGVISLLSPSSKRSNSPNQV